MDMTAPLTGHAVRATFGDQQVFIQAYHSSTGHRSLRCSAHLRDNLPPQPDPKQLSASLHCPHCAGQLQGPAAA